MRAWGCFLFVLSFSLSVFADSNDIRVERLRTKDQIDAFYCKVTTGSKQKLAKRPCETPNHFPLDVIYAPKSLGDVLVSHINSAFAQKLYIEVNNSDFFHGHPISKGPLTRFESLAQYFQSISGFLFHSDEYTNRWPHDPEQGPRSFVGLIDTKDVVPAIDLVPAGRLGRNYPFSGTITLEELLSAQPQLSQLYGGEQIKVKTCKDCGYCDLLNSVDFISDPKGRFKLNSGETIELSFRCSYNPYR